MASINIRVGDNIFCHLQLFDGDETKYVRAELRDASRAILAGSPLSLSHEGNGLYINDSLVMPDTAYVTVRYRVFNDAGFTEISEIHGDEIDIFNQIPPVSLESSILDILNDIDNNVDTLINTGLSSTVLHFTGEIVAQENLSGEIEPISNIIGYIEPTETIVGLILDESIELNLLEQENIEGEIS